MSNINGNWPEVWSGFEQHSDRLMTEVGVSRESESPSAVGSLDFPGLVNRLESQVLSMHVPFRDILWVHRQP